MQRDFTLPDLGEGLTDGEVVKWLVQPGDHVKLNQPIAEVETAKAAVELPSPYAGVVTRLHAPEGATVEVGATLISFDVDGGAANGQPAQVADPTADEDQPPNLVGTSPARQVRRRRPPKTAARPVDEPAATSQPRPERPLATPPVRKYAKDQGIDLRQLTGTGKDGRVTREDVDQALSARAPAAAARPPRGRGERREAVSATRRAIAKQMVASASTIPHVTEFLTVDVTELLALRDRLRALPEAADVRLTPLAVAARAVCVAARRHPYMNASWDDDTGEIVLPGSVNLGIATDTEAGLLVPNVKDADTLGIIDLAREVARLTDLARARAATPHDLRGGTITITNVGGLGVETGTPIINKPECAIIATGSIAARPWVVDGALAVRSVMTVSVSFDHRIVDGAYAAKFLAGLRDLLEQPALLAAF